MRLKEIKLVGFKSFVDATTVLLPGNRSAVVGPNGCGKSNIVDAVRWVMGESSARQLRGEALTDVIFNGSTSRQATSLAAVELLFDNRDARVGGKFSAYAEIAIRREVGRDSQSVYSLNGTRCRRRDIADVFLGTGFGPRSYSIIEQGMISELVEAKPDALRSYLEEAAGVSKYKERRRETHNRIRHTVENLARLADIREELDRQLAHLKRQANAAERFRKLKAEERRRAAELLALRIKAVVESLRESNAVAKELEVRLEEALSVRQALDTAIEKRRADHAEQERAANDAQATKYQVDSIAGQLEQAIEFDRQRIRELQAETQTLATRQQETSDQLEADVARIAAIGAQLEETQPQLAQAKANDESAAQSLEAVEARVRSRQAEWDDFTRRASANDNERRLCEDRVNHAEEASSRLRARLDKLEQEPAPPVDDGIDGIAEQLRQAKSELDALDEALAANAETLADARRETAQAERSLDAARAESQRQRRELAAVAAVQSAALGRRENGRDDAERWLRQRDLFDAPRLGERLQVEAGWERAVEAALGTDVQAIVVQDLDGHAAQIDAIANGAVTLLDAEASSPRTSGDLPALASFVSGECGSLLDGIYAAESVAAALESRGRLGPGESIVTQDGVRLGRDWVRVHRGKDDTAGVIERGRELKAREAQSQEAVAQLGKEEARLTKAREAAAAAEGEREALRSRHAEAAARCSRLQTEHDVRRVRIEEAAAAVQRMATEKAELRTQLDAESTRIETSRARLKTLAVDAKRLQEAGAALRTSREQDANAAAQARQAAHRATDAFHRLHTECQKLETSLAEAEKARARLLAQRGELAQRGDAIRAGVAEIEAAIPGKEAARNEKLSESRTLERKLADFRRALDAIEADIQEHTTRRLDADRSADDVRSRLQDAKVALAKLTADRDNLQSQLADTGISPQEAQDGLPETATEEQWQAALDALAQRIARLGPINLAAIDEYETQSERKVYLDRQHEDLETALATLQNAIARIDRDTRVRFKETFDRVNEHLKTLFPKVFGGGQAVLEVTDDDWLETGVTLMARPPGKRNASIHQLSGGEKAMAAVALIFSIFQLNPSPVCLLDEVDAPLDDSNVGRFAELIREMSNDVQFVVITHNKQTIEMADYLLGVTMQEPGVSRLVSVDVDKAARMAAAG